MAAIYEINEVGFIGAIWQGHIAAPLVIGRTVEIISNSSKTLFFTAREDVDIDRINSQVPDDMYYEEGYLDEEEIRNLELFTNVSPIYSRTLKVLFGFKKQDTEKRSANSRLPLQKLWKFNSSDRNNPKYTYDDNTESIRYINYTFLVTRSQLEIIISYFANAERRYDMIDIRGFNNPNLLIKKSSGDLVDISNEFPIDPPEFTGSLFTIPPADLETYAETAAEIDFRNHAAAYSVHSMDEVNAKLKELQSESNFIFSKIDILSGVEKIDAVIRAKVIEKLRAFVISQMIALSSGNPSNSNSGGHSISDLDGFMLDETGSFVKIISSGSNLSNITLVNTSSSDDLDELIDDIIDELTLDDNDVYTYKKISKVTDYATPTVKHKTYGLFKCSGEKLSTFFTGSLTEKNSKYYTSVYNNPVGTPNSYHQFDIAYAHISGSGSSFVEDGLDLTPAKAMYSKYMLECFGNARIKFPFKNGKNGDYFYAIQLDRNALRDKLDSGNFELTLCPLSGSANQLYNTGSNYRADQSSSTLFTLIDESGDTLQKITDNGGHQEYYFISSGSLRDGLYGESTDDAWGIVFPNMGLIILDGVVLDQSCSFNTVTASYIDGDNSRKLFVSISGSATRNVVRTNSGSFFARSAETDIVETYFCRAEHYEFNNSTNYTYTTGSDSIIRYDYFKKEPNSYITTIGMYNKNKELIAIGKLKQPVLKNDGNAYTFQVQVKLN